MALKVLLTRVATVKPAEETRCLLSSRGVAVSDVFGERKSLAPRRPRRGAPTGFG